MTEIRTSGDHRMFRTRRAVTAVAAVAVLPLAVTACSGGGGDEGKSKGGGKSSQSGQSKKDQAGKGKQGKMDKGTFGPACASVPKKGKGSFGGMAKDPVATAASHNPQLTTLVDAVKKAGLTDTLNNAKNITVFAPTNDAFKKVPKKTLDKVMGDKKMLRKVLTYHVVGQPLPKDKLKHGSYPTLEKQKLTTSGSGDSYKVNDTAKVGCGNVKTKNATVHLVDNVLMPPK